MAKNTAKSSVKPTRRAASTKRPSKRTARTSPVKAKKTSGRKAPGKRTETKGGPEDDEFTKKLGLRGAAPWAARHAAKHAEEVRQRNSSPAPPGSARATLRVPAGADKIKAEIAELHQALSRARQLQKKLAAGFYELGMLLDYIRERRLYEAKGYGSFEAFIDREVDLPKNTALKLVRVPSVFQLEAAMEHGLEAVLSALGALDAARAGDAPARRAPLPLKPPGANGRG